jgi:hypothetical protein
MCDLTPDESFWVSEVVVMSTEGKELDEFALVDGCAIRRLEIKFCSGAKLVVEAARAHLVLEKAIKKYEEWNEEG